jgi:hypothetical protein
VASSNSDITRAESRATSTRQVLTASLTAGAPSQRLPETYITLEAFSCETSL